jgi:hypothetical protein
MNTGSTLPKSVHVLTSSKLPSALFCARIAAASSSALPWNESGDPDHVPTGQPVEAEVCSSRYELLAAIIRQMRSLFASIKSRKNLHVPRTAQIAVGVRCWNM